MAYYRGRNGRILFHSAHAEDLGCVSTTFKALSPNDKVCVSVFQNPQVPGVACHISQARKGGGASHSA